jgi:antitoxin component YwqK of YwqJK toxin-antitoxin module
MKQDKMSRNKKGQPHGYWECYWPNGELWYKGNYISGKPDGLWESYYSDGQLWYKGNFINGKGDGLWMWTWNNYKQIKFYL